MGNDKSELHWGVAQHLEFIEFRLFWEGHLNRIDLMKQVKLSANQASADLNRYIGFAPDNMVYDKRARTYVCGPEYASHFLEPDASRYLAQLRSLANGIKESDDTWVAELPSPDAASTPDRRVDPVTLRSVVSAIRRSDVIEVKYQSLSRPESVWRRVASHAIGFDGFRRHTRAFCKTGEAFKDFLLSRILQSRGVQDNEVTDAFGKVWQEHVTLEIGAHPALSEIQKKVIALDYGRRGGKAKIKVRQAPLYYALKRLGRDTTPSTGKSEEQQIVLINRDVFFGENTAGHVL